MIRRDPVGVVGQIAPWNYPLMMAAWKIAPALAAGNTVMFKPSECTPLTMLALVEDIKKLFPAGVLRDLAEYISLSCSSLKFYVMGSKPDPISAGLPVGADIETVSEVIFARALKG